MGFLDRLFKRNEIQTATKLQMINENGNFLYSFNGKVYDNDIVRSAIRPFAKAVGKLVPIAVRENNEGNVDIDSNVNLRFLLTDCNAYMSMQTLLEKLAVQLKLNNNAFALIVRNQHGIPVELYPISCTSVEAIYSEDCELFLKFILTNGKTVIYSYNDIIHLRQDVNESDLFGESPVKALSKLIEVAEVADKSLVSAVRTSSNIRWMLKYNQTLRKEDIERGANEFTDAFLTNGKGVIATDSKMEAVPVNQNQYVPENAYSHSVKQRIYDFFGVNESIVQSKFSEDEWNSFYELQIEPIAIELSNELTRKLYNRRERVFGHRIIVQSASLQYASMQSKLNLVQLLDRQCLTINELRTILNLPRLANGNTLLRRLDTAEVDINDNADSNNNNDTDSNTDE